jgi:hypothetical protein
MRKDPAAVSLGRRGGRVKVPKGLAMLTPEHKSKIARQGAAALWERYYREHPEKKKTARTAASRKKKSV